MSIADKEPKQHCSDDAVNNQQLPGIHNNLYAEAQFLAMTEAVCLSTAHFAVV